MRKPLDGSAHTLIPAGMWGNSGGSLLKLFICTRFFARREGDVFTPEVTYGPETGPALRTDHLACQMHTDQPERSVELGSPTPA